MGNAFDKILEVLTEIDKILSTVESITPFSGGSLDTYRLGAESIRLQIATTPEQNRAAEADIIAKRLQSLESLVKKVIISHLDNITPPLKKAWNPSLTNISLSLAELKILADSLVNQIKEQNRTHIKSMKLLVEKIASKAPPDLLEELQSLLSTLENSPATPVAPHTVKELKKKAQPYKIKITRTWVFPVMEEEKPLSPLLKEIDALQHQLQELVHEHSKLAQQEFFPDYAEDFLLSDWVKDYKEKTVDSEKARVVMASRFKHTVEHPDYHKTLIGELKQTNSLLKAANQQRQELGEKIRARETLLYPSEDNPVELDELLLTARTTLKTHFETFLLTFYVVDVSNKKDKDTLFFLQELLHFINQLSKKLGAHPSIVNISAIDSCHRTLLMHIGENKRFLVWSTALSKMEEKNITALSNQLFDVPPDSVAIKKQIAAAYHLAALIEAFPIQAIKNYQVLKTINEEEHQKILSEEQCISTDIEKAIRQLSEYYDLLLGELGEANPFLQVAKIKDKLESFQLAVENEAMLYGDSRENILNQASPLDRGTQLSSLQTDRVRQMNDNKDALQLLQKEAVPLIEALKKRFHQKKMDLKDSLSDAVLNAQASLEFIHPSVGLFKGTEQEHSEFKASLQSAKELLATVNEYKDHITPLKSKVEAAVKQLHQQMETVKQRLKEHITPEYDAAKKAYEKKPLPLLHAANPLQATLTEAFKTTREALNQLDQLFAETDQLKGGDLQRWYTSWDMTVSQFCNRLEYREQAIQNAMEIERRLKTPFYATSCDILKKLENEFKRLTEKYIARAIHKTADHQESGLLQQFKVQSDMSLAAYEKSLLDRIDPRLHTLAQMHREFTAINQSYINEDIKRSQDRLYFTQLTERVDHHFRNDHMEMLSDGIRHKWVQFIRINVLKPLQALSFNVSHYLKSGRQALFFVTLGACRTEKELVELGNDLSTHLAASAA